MISSNDVDQQRAVQALLLRVDPSWIAHYFRVIINVRRLVVFKGLIDLEEIGKLGLSFRVVTTIDKLVQGFTTCVWVWLIQNQGVELMKGECGLSVLSMKPSLLKKELTLIRTMRWFQPLH